MFSSEKEWIKNGKSVLGIELGSTRIKAVLIGEHHRPIATGYYEWENQLVDGIWTYSLADIWKGLQGCYQNMTADVKKKYAAYKENVEEGSKNKGGTD